MIVSTPEQKHTELPAGIAPGKPVPMKADRFPLSDADRILTTLYETKGDLRSATVAATRMLPPRQGAEAEVARQRPGSTGARP